MKLLSAISILKTHVCLGWKALLWWWLFDISLCNTFLLYWAEVPIIYFKEFCYFSLLLLFVLYSTVVGNACLNKAEAALPRAFPHGGSSDDYISNSDVESIRDTEGPCRCQDCWVWHCHGWCIWTLHIKEEFEVQSPGKSIKKTGGFHPYSKHDIKHQSETFLVYCSFPSVSSICCSCIKIVLSHQGKMISAPLKNFFTR